jgi:benzoate-CoA ligase family protein
VKQHNMAYALLERNLTCRPDKIVFYCGHRTATYAQVAAYVKKFGSFLLKSGVHPGDRVAIVLPDSLPYVTAFLGSIYCGATAVCLNTVMKKPDYEETLIHCEAKILITEKGHDSALVQTDFLAHVAFLDDNTLDDVLDAMPEDLEPFAAAEHDPACLFYTSGTTGHAKGVPHRHGELPYLVESFPRDVLGMSENDLVFSASKLFFSYGLGNALIFPMHFGASSVLLAQAVTPQLVIETILRHKPTVFCGVPTLYNAILNFIEGAISLDSLRACVSAGEAFPPAVFQEWEKKVGVNICNGYGSTETFHINTAGWLRDAPEVSGVMLAHFEGKIVDKEGNPVPEGEPGVLLVKGKTVMPGYWNDSEWTQKTLLPGGWLNTGDVFIERQGVLTHLGRNDDMLKIGGIWVSPVKVESALLSHPAVLQCAVTGRTVGGLTMLRAHVVVAGGVEAGPKLIGVLRRHAMEQLPKYMCPTDFVFCDVLPQTATGKLQRFKLRVEVAKADASPSS